MPGLLNHSPARVLREILITAGYGTDAGDWPVKVDGEPDLPDNCLTLYNTPGRDDGYTQFGERQDWHGVQLRVRSSYPESGYVKARQIAVYLDAVINGQVTIGDDRYVTQSAARTTDVLPLGKDAPNSSRRIFTVDFLICVTMRPTL